MIYSLIGYRNLLQCSFALLFVLLQTSMIPDIRYMVSVSQNVLVIAIGVLVLEIIIAFNAKCNFMCWPGYIGPVLLVEQLGCTSSVQ